MKKMKQNTSPAIVGIGCRRWLAALACAAGLAGCAWAPPRASVSDVEQPFDRAATTAADGLAGQLPSGRHVLVADPMIDATSGQRTAATRRLEQGVLDRLAALRPELQARRFDTPGLAEADWLLTGTLARRTPGDPRSPLVVQLAVTRIASREVLAQARALAAPQGVDLTPAAAEQDSPVLPRDATLEGYARTSATPPGQGADALYMDSLPVGPLVGEATGLYEAGRYQEAHARYAAAAALPGGEQKRVLSGLYLTAYRLGRADEARAAFGRLVALGLAQRHLELKFLFRPGSTDFWPDPQVSGAYGMWLDELAAGTERTGRCLDVVGHTSRTGGEALNDALSLRRAEAIRSRLLVQAPALDPRLHPAGRGFRENLVGTGTDDAVDALDRRVEFLVAPCSR